jgi:serine/threonine protein kinase
VGNYEIVKPIGAGGMGQVFLAQHRTIRARRAAIKVAHDRDRSERSTAEFYNEIETLSRIRHPNVVSLLDAGEDGAGTFWMALEYIEGRSLSDLLREEGRLLIEDALLICAEIADGVAAAHDIGVLHRDIKPANVIVTPDDQIKVVDFGIAKLTREVPANAHMTQDGMVKGTVAFLSPEAVVKVPGVKADHRQDVFALGVLLFLLLAGRHPFAEPDGSMPGGSELGQRILMMKEPWLPHMLHGFPEDVARIVGKMMMKAPSDRYATMREVADALKAARARFLQNQPTPQLRSIASRRAARETQAREAGAVQDPQLSVGRARQDSAARRGGTVASRPLGPHEHADLSNLLAGSRALPAPQPADPKRTVVMQTEIGSGPLPYGVPLESDQLHEVIDEDVSSHPNPARPAHGQQIPQGMSQAAFEQAQAAHLRSLERRGRGRQMSHPGPLQPVAVRPQPKVAPVVVFAGVALAIAVVLGLLILLR